MAHPSEDAIMEEREEVMVSPTGGNPTIRTAHFLRPTVTSIKDSSPKLPSLFLSSKPTISEFQKSPLKVLFCGWRCPQEKWKAWVHRLKPIYQPIWKKAGIYEAILASTCNIIRDNDVVIELAKRWCVETNTFIFPWGEATITLEDVMVLGGYSVLGDPVSIPLKTKELIEIEERMKKAQREGKSRGARGVSNNAWMDHFMDNGSQFEHEAFLVLWLSRFVFILSTTNYNYIIRRAFPIAIHLSQGTLVALAPAVLAAIYKDLSLLKNSLDGLVKMGADETVITLRAPFQLVQLWAWERFPTLRPVPNATGCGEPRSARWHGLKKLNVENLRMAIDCAGECFLWRPYATCASNLMFGKFYRENEVWVLVKSDMDEELESFARCLRVCELVGLDCIEQYLPHRVAMQFGMDQDIPGCVARFNETPENAWSSYNRPIRDAKLYIPPRLFESDVTAQYLNWWNQLMLGLEDADKGIVRKQRSKTYRRRPRVFRGNKEDNHAFYRMEDVEEDKLKVAEMLKCSKNHKSVRNGLAGDDKPLPGNHFQIPLTLVADIGVAKGMESLTKPVEVSMQSKALLGRPRISMEDANVSKEKGPSMSVKSEAESSSYGETEILALELEARISKLERLVAGLSAEKFGHRFEGKRPT